MTKLIALKSISAAKWPEDLSKVALAQVRRREVRAPTRGGIAAKLDVLAV
jgi:hypothetical protein